MAPAELTQRNVTDAGIAAHLADDLNLLPPEISELSDQAALFAGNQYNAFWFTGPADADSSAMNYGEALATKAIEKVIELDERRRKEDDPAGDAGMIVELAAKQREEAVRYANGQFLINGIAYSQREVDQALDIAEQRINDRADEEGWSNERRARALEDVENARNAETPEAQAAAIDDMRQNPDAFNEFEQGLQDVRANNLRHEESADLEISTTADGQIFAEQRSATMDDTTLVAENATARSGLSVGDNPFADTRSSSEAFNPAARGEVAQTELAANATPSPVSEQRFEI